MTGQDVAAMAAMVGGLVAFGVAVVLAFAAAVAAVYWIGMTLILLALGQ